MAFAVYSLLREYEIYRLKKRIYRIRLVDELSNFVERAVKRDVLSRIDANLKAAGSPLGLTAETYILASAGLFLFSIFYAYLTRMEGIQALMMILLGLFGIDIYIHFAKKERAEAFRREMPEIVDLFELGAAADVPLEDIFLIAAESAQAKEVRNVLTMLAAEYIMTREKEGCLKNFCNEVNLPEAYILAMALLQGERTGRTLEILSTLSSSLFNTATAKIARQDKAMEYKVLAATFFLMASIVTLYMYPYFTNIHGGLRLLF
ncbi:type II secretion protein F [Thermosediminibacter litoriperuensis]|uniref:Tight adherence protein B/tight adherence protein C n=1 Tax=Thermosediminibacter litoriperuensis TaxID=291989 RepID=A0A5S5AY31_9FIRM|nr:type II secretion protein F [Thermosediminibacter litoriperuensis]TYP56819.1 tight adherence protein B/tight adherence protein C [Thermosediminibacter litoriperuensis]